ncbi:unnamed protein product, partial [Phaeothamnion confervicola]
YFIPGDGDDAEHPNVFHLPSSTVVNGSVRLGDVQRHFPLPGAFHFRFMKKFRDGHVWVDTSDANAPVPSCDGAFTAKVSRLPADGASFTPDFQQATSQPPAAFAASGFSGGGASFGNSGAGGAYCVGRSGNCKRFYALPLSTQTSHASERMEGHELLQVAPLPGFRSAVQWARVAVRICTALTVPGFGEDELCEFNPSFGSVKTYIRPVIFSGKAHSNAFPPPAFFFCFPTTSSLQPQRGWMRTICSTWA